MSRAKNWCFTLNNYSEDDVKRLSTLRDTCVYIIFGREVGENGTPHLQGFASFSNRMVFANAKAYISEQCHLEVARLCSNSIEYCKKEGNFVEIGVPPSNPGKRQDIEDFKTAVKEGLDDLREVREKHSEVYMKYPRFCMEYIRDNKKAREVPSHEFYGWQRELNEYLNREPDDRTVVFVVDLIGNKGKTWFAHMYCQSHENVQILMPGKKADLAFMLNEKARVVFIDAPRSKQQEYIQYDFLEEMKNGYVFSPKYESCVKTLNKLHVVVLMNESPDMTKLSADRYKIVNVS